MRNRRFGPGRALISGLGKRNQRETYEGKLMLKLISVFLVILTSTQLQAGEMILNCKGPRGSVFTKLNLWKNAKGTLKREAKLDYQYDTARLVCSGSTLEDTGCVGFWGENKSQNIAQVYFSKEKGNLVAVFETAPNYGEKIVKLNCSTI